MLIVTSTTDSVAVVTTAAVATHVQTSWVDNASGTITPGRTNTIISTATTTTVVAAPGSGVQRNVRLMTIRAVGGAQGVTVQHTDGTNVVQLLNVALATGESIVIDELGFQVLGTDGAMKQATAGSGLGRLLKTTTYITGSGNHTTQATTTSIRVRLVGGGGGGGGTSTTAANAAVGGGGGSGGYLEKFVTVVPSTAYAYVCGALGGGGAATGATGSAGSASTFIVSGTTYTANGGSGGVGQTFGTAAAAVLGGAGAAISTNGDLNGGGAPGECGWRENGTIAVSGFGGSSVFGRGGNSLNTEAAGNPGVGPGAGGGGACCLGTTARAGGAGIAGCVVVDEFS